MMRSSLMQCNDITYLQFTKVHVNKGSFRQQRACLHTSAPNTSLTTSPLTLIRFATVTGRGSRRDASDGESSETQQQQLLQGGAATGTSDAAATANSSSAAEPMDANTSVASTAAVSPSQQRQGRPPKQQTAAADAIENATPASPAKRTRGRPKKERPPLPSVSVISQQLVAVTGLPPAVADKLAAAQLKDRSVPQEFDELKRRVLLALQLFGDARGARALQNYPKLVCTRPEVLSRHLQSWVAFFDDMPGGPVANESKLLERLVSRPQLLAVNVENLVGNLYEIGTILQAEDLHMFAAQAMKLALMRPEVVQEKMRRVLLLLNSEARMHASQLKGIPRQTASQAPADIGYADIQKAARRDYRWLMLSTETLEARLLGLQQVLQVSLVAVGRVFVLQPSLVNKTTQHIAEKYAALAGLPDMERQQAKGAVLAFPALLNLRSELLQHRWQRLREAANSSSTWQHELLNIPAGSLPTLLTVTNSRYDRLQAVAACGQQASRKMGALLHMSDKAFEAFAAKYLQPQPHQQQQASPEKEHSG